MSVTFLIVSFSSRQVFLKMTYAIDNIVIRTRGIMIYQTSRSTGNTFLGTLRLFKVNNLLLINIRNTAYDGFVV